MIPQGFITQLLERADIVDVVGQAVPLKKTGRNFQCCCPFHNEKTPSFNVSPQKQIYKCFGCGVSGNAIGFLMAYENLEFPDAVRRLASMYGMEVPEDRSPRRRAQREKVRSLTDYMQEAQDFYRAKIETNARVKHYVEERRLSAETCERFGLGYSPDEWHALEGVFKERYKEKALLECGLVNEKNGRRYDAFRGRLMFPIRNTKGHVIGFGARTLNGDEHPKYLNSPETPIYHKGSELYGLFEGRDAVREKGRAIVCEGYMDVIQLSQAGFREAVAALGTSITPEHVRKLFKLTNRVYFSFDGDGAGRKAAVRALEATLSVVTDEQKAFFIILPPEHDPDSLIKAEGPEGYEREVEKAFPLTEFVRRVLTEGKELEYADERAQVVAEARAWVISMTNAPFLRLALIKELASVTRFTVDELERQYGLATGPRPAAAAVGGSRPQQGGRGAVLATGWDPAAAYAARRSRERGFRGGFRTGYRNGYRGELARYEPRVGVTDKRWRLLQCLLVYPDLFNEFQDRIVDLFLESQNAIAQTIIDVWRESINESTGEVCVSPASLLMSLEEKPYYDNCVRLIEEELKLETPREGALVELNRAFLELELERVKAKIADAPADPVQLRALITRQFDLLGLIAESREAESEYRFRRIRHEEVAASRQHKVVYSDNAIVRGIQERLFGPEEKDGGDTVADAALQPVGEPGGQHAAHGAHAELGAAIREGARRRRERELAAAEAVAAPTPEEDLPAAVEGVPAGPEHLEAVPADYAPEDFLEPEAEEVDWAAYEALERSGR